MAANNLLRPLVVALLPHDQAAPIIHQSIIPSYPDCVVIALASSQQESTRLQKGMGWR